MFISSRDFQVHADGRHSMVYVNTYQKSTYLDIYLVFQHDVHTSVCMLTQAVIMYFKTTDYPKFTRPILHRVKHVNVTLDFDEIYT